MLKLMKLLFLLLLLLGAAHKSILSSPAANPDLPAAEAEFADLIVAADIKLNLNDRTTAEQYLTQANQTLSQNPTMHIYLQ